MNLEIYNPANARRLTKEQIDDMQNLTVEDIKQLAAMFPNTARGGAYLVLKDTKAKAQLYPLSTWQNLHNLISKQNKKQYVAFAFRELFLKSTSAKQPEIPLGKVQDLTKEEVSQAEGLKFVNEYMPGFPQIAVIENEPMPDEPVYYDETVKKKSRKKS